MDGESCRGVAHSNDFGGQLDTRGAPLQLGHRFGDGDLEESEEGDVMSLGRSFKGCLKNLRISGEVSISGKMLTNVME